MTEPPIGLYTARYMGNVPLLDYQYGYKYIIGIAAYEHHYAVTLSDGNVVDYYNNADGKNIWQTWDSFKSFEL